MDGSDDSSDDALSGGGGPCVVSKPGASAFNLVHDQPTSHLVPSSSSSRLSGSNDPSTHGPSTTTLSPTTQNHQHNLTSSSTSSSSHLLNIIPVDGSIQSTVSKVAHNQQSKCVNEKRRREQENGYIEELAELISAKLSSMNSLAVKPDKCAILQETVKQIRIIKQESPENDDLQASEVSSSGPSIAHDLYGPLLLEALDGFLFVVNQDGKIEFVSENVTSFLNYSQRELTEKRIYDVLADEDHGRFCSAILPMSALGNGFSWPSSSSHGPDSSSPTSGLVGGVNSSNVSKPRTFNARFKVKRKSGSSESFQNDEASGDNLFSQCPDDGYTTSPSIGSSTTNQVYENMQISTVLLPYPKSEASSSLGSEPPTAKRDLSLVCVARRIPQSERTPSNIQVEQFSTRLDFTGKVMAIDTSGVSSTYSQYLNKDLIGKELLQLCHPQDVHKLKKHLEEVLSRQGYATSSIYRLMVARDRFVCVQTKSRMFTGNSEYVMAAHSIIRDSDSTTLTPSSSGSNTGTTGNYTDVVMASSSSTTPSRPSSSVVGGGGDPLPGLIQPEPSASSSHGRSSSSLTSCETVTTSAVSSYSGYTSMSPSTNVVTSDLLNDCLGLSDMDFPSSSWADYSNDAASNDSNHASLGLSAESVSDSQADGHKASTLIIKSEPSSSYTPSSCTATSGTSAKSPARAATPSSTTASPRAASFNSSSLQQQSNQSSFSPSLQIKSSPPGTGSRVTTPSPSPTANSSGQGSATDKLRNLLTHGGSDDGQSAGTPLNTSGNNSRDDILRTLLDEDGDFGSSSNPGLGISNSSMPLSSSAPSSIPASATSDFMFESTSNSGPQGDKKPLMNHNFVNNSSNVNNGGNGSNGNNNNGSNNMLRKLLNDPNDVEASKNYRSKSNPGMLSDDQVPAGQPVTSGFGSSMSMSSTYQRFASTPAAQKRKSVDDHYMNPGSVGSTPSTPQSAGTLGSFDYNVNKRPLSTATSAPVSNSVQSVATGQQQSKQQTQQLAGQNPMLASMLAQTPKTLPTAPIAIPTSIVSQVPQERLPKNLEKKLVHTPNTGLPEGHMIITSSTGTSQMVVVSSAQYQSNLVPTSQVQMQQKHPSQMSLGPTGIMIQQGSQGLVLNQARLQMNSDMGGSAQGILNKFLMDTPRGAVPSQMVSSSQSSAMYHQPSSQSGLPPIQSQESPMVLGQQQSNVTLKMPSASSSGILELDSQPDPSLDDILDQVWSLQQEMNHDGSPVIHIQSQSLNPSHSAASSTINTTTDDLLQILDEVLEPQAPNIATPTTPTIVTAPRHMNDEKLAISQIQQQLMSFDPGQQKPIRQQVYIQQQMHHQQQQQVVYSNYLQQQPAGPPPAYSAHQVPNQGLRQRINLTPQHHQQLMGVQRPVQLQQQQQHFVTGIVNQQQQNYSPVGMVSGQGGPVRMAKGKGAAGGRTGQLSQKQRQMMMQQQQPMQSNQNSNEMSHNAGGYLQENLSEMLNSTIPPNVSPFGSSNSPVPPKTAAGLMNQSGPVSQMSPGQRPPFSPQQSSYPSPSPVPNYASNRMSPYASVNSPHGPNSPASAFHAQSSPQPQTPSGNQPQPGWPVRAQQRDVRMQQKNPLLNAQLAVGPQQPGPPQPQQIQYSQRPPGNMHRLPTPNQLGTIQRNSPVPPQFPPSPGPYQQGQAPTRPGGPNARLVQLTPQTQRTTVQLPRQGANSPRVMNDSSFPGYSGVPIQLETRSPTNQQYTYNEPQRPNTSLNVKQNLKMLIDSRNSNNNNNNQQQQQQSQPQTSQVQQMNQLQNQSPSTSSSSMGNMSFAQSSVMNSSIPDDMLDFSLDHLPDSLMMPEPRDRQDSFSSLFENLANDIASSSSGPNSSPLTSMASSPAGLMRSQSMNSPQMNDGNQPRQQNSSLLQQLLSENT